MSDLLSLLSWRDSKHWIVTPLEGTTHTHTHRHAHSDSDKHFLIISQLCEFGLTIMLLLAALSLNHNSMITQTHTLMFFVFHYNISSLKKHSLQNKNLLIIYYCY